MPFEEETRTQVVNPHGALITLETEVSYGRQLILKNKNTGEKHEARVVFLESKKEGKTLVGVEFTDPAPTFGGLIFRRRTGILSQSSPPVLFHSYRSERLNSTRI